MNGIPFFVSVIFSDRLSSSSEQLQYLKVIVILFYHALYCDICFTVSRVERNKFLRIELLMRVRSLNPYATTPPRDAS